LESLRRAVRSAMTSCGKSRSSQKTYINLWPTYTPSPSSSPRPLHPRCTTQDPTTTSSLTTAQPHFAGVSPTTSPGPHPMSWPSTRSAATTSLSCSSARPSTAKPGPGDRQDHHGRAMSFSISRRWYVVSGISLLPFMAG